MCSCTGFFYDVFVGFPARMHDAHIFRNSCIFGKLLSGEIFTDHFACGLPAVLLADSAYPSQPFVLKKFYRRHVADASPFEVLFDKSLSSARVAIENAFSRVKSRFQIVKEYSSSSIEHAPVLLSSCFALHNVIEVDHVPRSVCTTLPRDFGPCPRISSGEDVRKAVFQW